MRPRILAAAIAVALVLAGCGSESNTATPGTSASPASETAGLETLAPPDPSCVQFDAEGVYTSTVGTLPLTLTVPGAPSAPWRGDRDAFFLGKASCDPGEIPSIFFHADLVGSVYLDGCTWTTSRAEVPTAFAAVEAVASQLGHPTSAPVETMVGPFRASRMDIALPATFDTSACDGGQLKLWLDEPIVPGIAMQVYIAEVDGTTLGIVVGYDDAVTGPSDLGEIDAILQSLRIDI